jgi:hypothetical protein
MCCPHCGREDASGLGQCTGCAVALTEPSDPDAPLAVLRNEIQHSGTLIGRLRRIGAVAGVTAGPCCLLAILFLASRWPFASWWQLAVLGLALMVLVLLGLVVGLGVGVPASGALLLERRAKLRQRLAELPREQQLAVLGPLRDARGDTRRLVAPLLRELRPPAELIPAATPSGRGDEASASD